MQSLEDLNKRRNVIVNRMKSIKNSYIIKPCDEQEYDKLRKELLDLDIKVIKIKDKSFGNDFNFISNEEIDELVYATSHLINELEKGENL